MTLTHGQLLGGLSTVPDLDRAVAAYRDVLGLQLVENGWVGAELAAHWGAPASVGARLATLQPTSGAPSFLRLVEQPDVPGFRPTRSYGWAAFEISVADVFALAAKLTGTDFPIIGPPKAIGGMSAFIPMQVLGPGREMLYLNQVLADMPDLDLPRAKAQVDSIFIGILATPDRAATVRWYRDLLGLEEGASFTIPYSMINRAFDLPDATPTTLTMVQKGRLPIVEVDDYPAAATPRPQHTGWLPPGNALVTLAVDRLDGLDPALFLAPPVTRPGPLYSGRRAGTVRGSAGELLELVEIG
jgi:catechol 2,3-dioxygenase-like lactoylglutathione lyase family enzyme